MPGPGQSSAISGARPSVARAGEAMMRRLLLVRHASTDAVRAGAFGADEPLDAAGADAAAGVRLPRAAEVLVSPARRTRETAACARLAVTAVEPALAECDFGRWAGCSLQAVAKREPDGVRAWMTDPAATPHDGESLLAVLTRVSAWLSFQARLEGTAIAITHAGVVKAAVVTALDAPPSAFWRIDVAPLSITELHAHDGRWTVTRVNDRPATVPAARDAGPPSTAKGSSAVGGRAERRRDPTAVAAAQGGRRALTAGDGRHAPTAVVRSGIAAARDGRGAASGIAAARDGRGAPAAVVASPFPELRA